MTASIHVPGAALGARPLRWCSSAQLEHASSVLRSVCAAWLRDWVGNDAALSLVCEARNAFEFAGEQAAVWEPLGAAEGAKVWVCAPQEDTLHVIHHILFGVAAAGRASMSPAIAQKARDALLANVRSTLELDDEHVDAPAEVFFRKWSGGVVVALNIDGRSLAIAMNGDAMSKLLPPIELPGPATPAAKVSLAEAAADCPLAITLELAAVRVSVGTLATLKPGDVIPLEHSLDEPLSLHSADAGLLCHGYLGKRGSRKAVQLAR